MKVLRIIGAILAGIAVLAGIAWLLRTDPVGPIAGRQLSGEEAAYPSDWSFSDEHMTIAVETRPDDPHSVTTICFVHEGELFVPAQGGSEKCWTHYILDDPRVRLKIGDRIYRAQAVRVTDADPESFIPSAAKKYSQLAERAGEELPEDIWLFRIEPPES